MAQTVPLDPTQHSQIQVRNIPEWEAAEGQQVLPVTVFEFAHAGNDCPVVFIKNAETGQFQSVMMLGLTQGENLMYREGKWQAMYVPTALRLAPFRMAMPEPGADSVAVFIDLDSPLVGEGERLFTDDGEATPFMEQRRDELQSYFRQGQVTRAFQSVLAEHDLLSSQTLTMEFDNQKVRIEGIYLVDEKKLRDLSDEVVLDLYRRGFMQAIYAHLMSLRQANRLAAARLEQKGSEARILGT